MTDPQALEGHSKASRHQNAMDMVAEQAKKHLYIPKMSVQLAPPQRTLEKTGFKMPQP